MRKDLQSFIVNKNASVLEALKLIDLNNTGIVFVVEDNCELLGTLTDGDVRRHILKNGSLEDKVISASNRAVHTVGSEETRASVLDLMQALDLMQVPIVDHQKRFQGVHLLKEIIGRAERPNVAMILAGGLGTRLKPLTNKTPKPMLPVAGRPILERLILHLVGFGIRKIYLSVNYLAEQIIDYFEDGKRFGCEIIFLHEKEELGTGGALKALPKGLNSPIILLNGDLVTQIKFDSLLRTHDLESNHCTIVTKEHSYKVPFGCLEIDGKSVKSMHEKPLQKWLINAGIYCFSPEVLNHLPSETSFPITALIEKLLVENKKVGAYSLEEDWIDVGEFDTFKKAISGE